jgi:hypothetical protein
MTPPDQSGRSSRELPMIIRVRTVGRGTPSVNPYQARHQRRKASGYDSRVSGS